MKLPNVSTSLAPSVSQETWLLPVIRKIFVMLVAGVGLLAFASPLFAQRLRSGESDVAVVVVFRNATDQEVSQIWMDYDGQPVEYGTIAPGESVDCETFVSHAWVFEVDGRRIGQYVATKAAKQQFTIDGEIGVEEGEEGGEESSDEEGKESMPTEDEDDAPSEESSDEEGDNEMPSEDGDGEEGDGEMPSEEGDGEDGEEGEDEMPSEENGEFEFTPVEVDEEDGMPFEEGNEEEMPADDEYEDDGFGPVGDAPNDPRQGAPQEEGVRFELVQRLEDLRGAKLPESLQDTSPENLQKQTTTISNGTGRALLVFMKDGENKLELFGELPPEENFTLLGCVGLDLVLAAKEGDTKGFATLKLKSGGMLIADDIPNKPAPQKSSLDKLRAPIRQVVAVKAQQIAVLRTVLKFVPPGTPAAKAILAEINRIRQIGRFRRLARGVFLVPVLGPGGRLRLPPAVAFRRAPPMLFVNLVRWRNAWGQELNLIAVPGWVVPAEPAVKVPAIPVIPVAPGAAVAAPGGPVPFNSFVRIQNRSRLMAFYTVRWQGQNGAWSRPSKVQVLDQDDWVVHSARNAIACQITYDGDPGAKVAFVAKGVGVYLGGPRTKPTDLAPISFRVRGQRMTLAP